MWDLTPVPRAGRKPRYLTRLEAAGLKGPNNHLLCSNQSKCDVFPDIVMPRKPIVDDSATGLPSAGSPEFDRSLVRGILDASPDGILVVDEHGVVALVNQRFFDVWGIPIDRVPGHQADTVIGTSDQPILSMAVERTKDPEAFLARVKELYADPNLDDHCEIELKDARTLERHSTVLRGGDGRLLGRIWFFRDITKRKRIEATLRELATHDSLTGVSNRRYFLDRVHKEFARARRYRTVFAVIAIDLDHFKDVNDKYGHASGDEVLKALCQCSAKILRETDLFARVGGEEFFALLYNAELGRAQLTAERLRHAVMQQEVLAENTVIHYTISAGVAAFNPADSSVEDILRRADSALYCAKKNGRNRIEVGALS